MDVSIRKITIFSPGNEVKVKLRSDILILELGCIKKRETSKVKRGMYAVTSFTQTCRVVFVQSSRARVTGCSNGKRHLE